MPTVKDLKNLAKERGLRGFHNLKKAELLRLLEVPIPAPRTKRKDFSEKPIPAPRTKKTILAPRPIPAPRNIMNILNPSISVPILQPEKVEAKQSEAPSLIEKTVETFSGWMNCLAESGQKYIVKPIPSSLKNLKEKINKIFEDKKFQVREGQSALQNFVREFTIEGKTCYDPRSFFEAVRNLILEIFWENKNTKVKMILICQMQRTDLRTGKIIEVVADFHSKIAINIGETDENELLDEMIARIGEVLANVQQNGSNWVFVKVNQLEIHLVEWQPLGGSSLLPLPKKLKDKKAVINMKNDDNQCFKWCISRALHFTNDHPERVTKDLIEFSERLNWDGLSFPVDLKQIKIFEKLNPLLSINVFGFEEVFYPLRISEIKKRINIDLLLISDEKRQHYCLINSLSRLVSNKLTKHNGSVNICRRCLNHFPNAKKLKIHKEYCSNNETVKIEMPKEGSCVSFVHHNRSVRVPFVVYADFEAFTKEISTCEPNAKFSFTKQYQQHQPSGFCFKIVCFDKRFNQKPVLFRAKSKDEDISAIFVQMLEQEIKRIHKIFDFAKKMIFSGQDKVDFEKAQICWICQKEFSEAERKVRDHCHFTGKYRGAAHVKCNLQFKKTKFTPVIIHNLSGYDSHLFVKNLGKSEGNINCIPNNEEKYVSFSKDIVVDEYENKKGEKVKVKHEIRFINSFKFMASSLSSLVENLAKI